MIHFDTFKKIIESLRQNKIRYWVFGGFAVDGVRGKITRTHNDLDIYLHSKDYTKMQFCRIENMPPFKSPAKIQTVKLMEENGLIIANHGSTFIKFPKDMFSKDVDVSIDNFEFRIIPREVLIFLSKFSNHEADKSFCAKLEYDKEQFNKIKEVKIK